MPTYEEMEEWRKKWKKEREEFEKELEEKRRKRWEEDGIKPFEAGPPPKKRCDHPNTMEDSTATVVWIVVMLVGSIFKGNWAIWIIATVVWAKFITRHDR
ncbi:MAG: hypothetical protein UH850_14855 [Paludibacteraceae bacterium]|nr:hypothetical protein [Paludibacteraceae bacterium]